MSRWCQVHQEAGMWSPPSGTHTGQDREAEAMGRARRFNEILMMFAQI